MKATTLSIWCISTTVIAYSHAFIFHRQMIFPPRLVGSQTQAQLDDNDDGMMTSLDRKSFLEVDNHRRAVLISLLSLQQLACQPTSAAAQSSNEKSSSTSVTISGIHDPQLQNYYNPLLPNWKGTALPGPLSLSEAYSQFILLPSLEKKPSTLSQDEVITTTTTTAVFPMGKWPDPILRKPASSIPHSIFQNKDQLNQLQLVATTLKNTARKEGAVGLAAQQCGIDASLIYIDGVTTTTSATSPALTRRKKNDQEVMMSTNGMNENLAGVFGQSNWRNSKKQITGEGVLVDDDNNKRSLQQRFDRSNTTIQQQPQPKKDDGIFLVNPRIVHRSPESEMLVWTEECLVLPPEFKATLLRDAEVTIEYETLTTTCLDNDDGCGETKQITLRGELARCAQHEMDHDKGILITDHVGLDELLSIQGQTLMADVEDSDGLHANRMEQAYARQIYDSTLLPSSRTHKNVDLAFGNRNDFLDKIEQVESGSLLDGNVRRSWFVQPANAVESIKENSTPSTSVENTQSADRFAGAATSCDEACLEERKRRIQERRAMMQQSRSSTNRGDVLELSRQRALMYGTTYKGLSPSACAKPGFCP
jgi:peptide deformylase